MIIPPKTSCLKSRSIRSQSPRFWLLIAAIASLSLLSVYGCSLMGTAPVKKKSLPEKKIAPISEPQLKAIQAERKQLLERVELVEKQLQQNQIEHEGRLKDMDRTILLLEKNILEIKGSVREISRKKVDKKKGEPKKVRDQSVKKPTAISPSSPPLPSPKKNSGTVGEIRTPETSKAIETVSLLNPARANKKSSRKSDNSKNKKFQIVGIDTKDKKNGSTTTRPVWEDPDLNEPLSPIQLKVVSGAKRRYQQAFKIYSSRNYAESIKQFNRFVADFSSDQDADNSQFWIGQSHFQLGNYLQAERAFRKVLKNYTHGSTRKGYKTPDAMLMLGRIYLIRKKPIKARSYFNRVVQQYPDSRSAVKAKKEIQAMDSF